MKTAILFSFAILMCSELPAAAEEDGTARNFEIDSTFATGAHWSIQDGCGILQITLPAIKDDLPLPKPPSIQIWLLQSDGSSTKPSTKGDSPVGVSMRGFTTPSLVYEFPKEAASTAVAAVVQLEGKFLVFSLLPGNNAAEQDGADEAAEKRVERTEEAFSQPLSAAALDSAEAVVIAKLTHAHLQKMAKSFPPIYSFSLGLTVEEVLSGEVKVGAQLELRHGAKQLHPPTYPVGKRMLVTVKFNGGAPRVHAIAVATDEDLVKARAALSALNGPVIDAGNSKTADQAGGGQAATRSESK